MIDPVLSESILLAAMAGALIVVFGALFAVFFAFARLKKNKRLMQLAYISYSLLVLSSLVFSWVLNLEGFWNLVVFVMLAGYFAGPHAIWRLCVKTHG